MPPNANDYALLAAHSLAIACDDSLSDMALAITNPKEWTRKHAWLWLEEQYPV